jgi:hypothetical protein
MDCPNFKNGLGPLGASSLVLQVPLSTSVTSSITWSLKVVLDSSTLKAMISHLYWTCMKFHTFNP